MARRQGEVRRRRKGLMQAPLEVLDPGDAEEILVQPDR